MKRTVSPNCFSMSVKPETEDQFDHAENQKTDDQRENRRKNRAADLGENTDVFTCPEKLYTAENTRGDPAPAADNTMQGPYPTRVNLKD